MVAEFKEEAPLLESTFAAYAPIASGRTAESVEASASFRSGGATITISAGARDPKSGYGYLDVTRRGHAGEIRPTRKRALAWENVVSASSRGSHPAEDWVVDAADAVESDMDALSQRLGRVLARQVL